MASLPPVILGAVILSAFAVSAILRPLLERRTVLQAPVSSRPKRQFALDLGLYLLAGLLAVTFNFSVYEFPAVSGLSLLFGCMVSGFFMALDTALARERKIIIDTMQNNESLPPPKRLFPVTRKFSLVSVATALFIALIIVMVITRDIVWLSKIEQTEAALTEAQISVTYEIFFIMAVLLVMTINLILSYSKNLRLLFDNETRVLERVSNGDLNKLVPVTTNDEFGLIADYTNTMIMGLRHRIKLITALKVAEEVQQNLLPHHAPEVPGLDIAGISIYCDATGGDYFDYLQLPDDRLGIVVADASDHGIGAALHMTTARAFLISGIPHFERPAALLNEINGYLVKDSAEMGRFVSMFLIFIDPATKNLFWVRAGHEPALLFDPSDAAFHKLNGEGIALGVDESYRYRESNRVGWTPGSVLVIGTDGIHEARNENGDYFGRQRLQDIIQKHHTLSAEGIQKTIVGELTDFRGAASQEDDITLVVVKLK